MATAETEEKDPYLWLEEIEGEKALKWVHARNADTTEELEKDPKYKVFENEALTIMNATDRVPYGRIRGEYVYNFWRDKTHVRGLWRRCSVAEYQKEKPAWEIVLDIDQLAKEEGENWVYKGPEYLEPENDRCILWLSKGGKDASVGREFDVIKKEFVSDGFFIPESKSRIDWIDKDTLYIGTDFGEGSLTESGYPRILKKWKRGTPLSEAELIFEGESTDVSAGGYVIRDSERVYHVLYRSITFHKTKMWMLDDDGNRHAVPIPEDAKIKGIFGGELLFQIKEDWGIKENQFIAGSFLSIPADAVKEGKSVAYTVFYEPDVKAGIQSVNFMKSGIFITILSDVKPKTLVFRKGENGWEQSEWKMPGTGSVSLFSTSIYTDQCFLDYDDFLTPSTLYLGNGADLKLTKIKSAPARFDSEGLETRQLWATSKDGTKVPYFIVSRKDLELNGKNPTLIDAYGGFEISRQPGYAGVLGKLWLERGGVYVLANIRGGGEFGPQWHLSAIKENRQRSFDDMIAVSEDVIRRKITSPEKLGIKGGSNGGLLMGVMITQRPELFRAVICGVPLLDMLRFHKLLAGASWVAEYGSPDVPEERKVLESYSPYHHVREGVEYPKTFFFTSTKDDRVHPGHARKMVARMQAQGHPLYYFENTEGGHGAASNNLQMARLSALQYTYLWKMMQP